MNDRDKVGLHKIADTFRYYVQHREPKMEFIKYEIELKLKSFVDENFIFLLFFFVFLFFHFLV